MWGYGLIPCYTRLTIASCQVMCIAPRRPLYGLALAPNFIVYIDIGVQRDSNFAFESTKRVSFARINIVIIMLIDGT